jgi:hypothetical protein
MGNYMQGKIVYKNQTKILLRHIDKFVYTRIITKWLVCNSSGLLYLMLRIQKQYTLSFVSLKLYLLL